MSTRSATGSLCGIVESLAYYANELSLFLKGSTISLRDVPFRTMPIRIK
jgi:hypothetical protein